MANITEIVHGSANWDVAANQNFDSLNAELASATSDTGWKSDGISLVNGFEIYSSNDSDKIVYRIANFGGVKDVLLFKGGLKTPTDFPINSWIKVMNMPQEILNFYGKNSAVQLGIICYTEANEPVRGAFNNVTGALSLYTSSTLKAGTRIQFNEIFVA